VPAIGGGGEARPAPRAPPPPASPLFSGGGGGFGFSAPAMQGVGGFSFDSAAAGLGAEAVGGLRRDYESATLHAMRSAAERQRAAAAAAAVPQD